ncbi:MAG TPA: transcriptional regulator, partial [Micromonosporaceae bacterium]
LIEGRTGRADERLDVDGLRQLLVSPQSREVAPENLAHWLVAQAEQANGGPFADDVAMLMLTPTGGVA